MDTSVLMPAAKAARTTVVLADDHPIFLEGLVRLLSPSYQIVSSVVDGRSLVEEACRLRPDVVIVDYIMPKLDGLAAVRELRAAGLDCKVIVLSVHEDPSYAVKCFEAGADGYIMKSEPPAQIIQGVGDVVEGRRRITPEIEGVVERLLSGSADADADTGTDTEEPEAAVVKSLTVRQKQIIRLLCSGEAAKRVGVTLGVSRKTVEYHKYKLMRRLGYSTTADLIKFAVRWRLDTEENSLQG